MKKFKKITGLLIGAPLLIVLALVLIPRGNRENILARMGNVESMYWLGEEYGKIQSDFVETNHQKAIWWLQRAAARGNVAAMYSLFLWWRDLNNEPLRYWLSKGVEAGHVMSAVEIVHGYEFGMYGYPKDPEKRQFYNQIYHFLDIEMAERGGKPRPLLRSASEWKRWVKRAAEVGDPDALYYLFLENYYTNPDEAREWLFKGVHAGSWVCAYELADGYWRSRYGFSRDSAKGLEFYNRGKALEAEAQVKPSNRQALLDALHKRVFEEMEMGLAPMKKRAEVGDFKVMEALARGYEQRGEEHWKGAVEWYMKASDAGSAEASMRLVRAYKEGQLGLPRDEEQSDQWFRKWQQTMNAKPARND